LIVKRRNLPKPVQNPFCISSFHIRAPDLKIANIVCFFPVSRFSIFLLNNQIFSPVYREQLVFFKEQIMAYIRITLV